MKSYIQRLLFKKTIPIIRVNGVISQNSLDSVEKQMQKINTRNIVAMGVVVNSPGGLPTQSDLICQRLEIFSKKHSIPLYTFAEDVAASGGYFVLCLGKTVFVNPSSIVGSIGVITQWMGLKNLLQKQGIETTHISSNKNLSQTILDPFREYDQNKLDEILPKLKGTHEMFKNHVLRYREVSPNLFNADVYNGEEAVGNGLADEIGNYQVVLRRLYPGCRLQELWLPSYWEEMRQINQEWKLQSFWG